MTHRTLIYRDDDIFSEKWTYAHYEIDGHYVDREAGAKLVLSARRFDTKHEVVSHLHKNLADSEWMYDIIRIVTVFEYEEVIKP